MAWIILILTFGIVWGGYRYTETKHPYTVPIQAGESKVQPMPVKPNPIAIKVTHANYDVPGRALRVTMKRDQQRRQRLPDWRIHHGRGALHQQGGPEASGPQLSEGTRGHRLIV